MISDERWETLIITTRETERDGHTHRHERQKER